MHLKIGFYPRKGWATILSENYENGERTYNIRGLSDHVTEYLSRSLNFSYVYKFSPDKIFGTELANGSWTGTIGMLYRKEIDIMVSSVFLTRRKFEVFQVSIPYAVVQTSILSSTETVGFMHFLQFLSALESEIWCLLLISMLFSSVAIAFGNYLFKENTKSHGQKNVVWFLEDALRLHLRGILQQSVTIFSLPKKPISRITAVIWILSCLILMKGFSGELKSVLMIEKEINPITKLEDLNDKPKVKPLMVAGEEFNSILSILQNYGNLVLYERLLQQMASESFKVDDLQSAKAFQNVKSGHSTIIYTESFLKSIAAPFCPEITGKRRFHFSEDKYLQRFLVHMAHKDLPLDVVMKINKSIRRLDELHIFPNWEKQYTKNFTTCETAKTPPEQNPLGLKHLNSVFYFVFICYGTASLVLLSENIFFFLSVAYTRFQTTKKLQKQPSLHLEEPIYLKQYKSYYKKIY